MYIVTGRHVRSTSDGLTDLHRNVHQLLRHVLIGSLQVAYQVPSKIFVFVSDKCVCRSLLTSATGPTDAMSVGVNVASYVVVDDRTNVWDVKTTCYTQDNVPCIQLVQAGHRINTSK